MSDERRGWMVWVAAMLVCAMLLPYGWPFPAARAVLLLLIVAGLAGGIAECVRVRGPRDHYDLQVLRAVDEAEKRAEREREVPDAEADWVFCPQCGEEYDPRFPQCPKCQ